MTDAEIGKQIGAYIGMSGIDAEDVAYIRKLIVPAQRPPTSAELFCDWLQGYFVGLAGKDELTASEANTIRNALNSLTASAVSHPTENIEPGA